MPLPTTAIQALAALVFTTALAHPNEQPVKNPTPELLTLDSGSMKIGIDRGKGASLTHISWVAHPKNVVNGYDPGRLIQQSYYSGRRLDRRPEGQHKAWSPWSWNPIQGGGTGSWARVRTFQKRDQDTLYAETIPKLWDMHDEEATAVMHQWTAFEPGMPNVAVVRCKLVCAREKNDRWGSATNSPQEVPATYFTRKFDTFKSYQGEGKWSDAPADVGPPWSRTTIARKAMACFDSAGQGIAIFSPIAESWNYGPHAGGKSDDPLGGPCVHIAPITRAKLGPRSTYSYRYWLVTGNEEQISKCLDQLWKKYAAEKAQLTDS